MAKQVGPFNTIEDAVLAADIAKKLSVAGTVQFYVGFGPEKSNGKTSNGSTRAKRVTCPDCGEKLKSAQSLGPHSRKHKQKAPAQEQTAVAQ